MGVFDSIGSALFGDGGASEISAASNKANQQLTQGYEAGQEYLGDATALYDPYVQSGQQSQQLYDDLLGLNGEEARARAQATITSDPAFQGGLAADSNAMLRALNARGQSGGGKAQLAAQRVLQENYGNAMSRYRDAGTQGLQATSGQANSLTNQGNLAYGYGATQAGQTINTGNAMAQASQAGVNNLIGLTGTIANAGATAYASDIRLKRDIERIGAMPSGLPVYRFKYLEGDDEFIGVMAHEARELFPDAVAESDDGYLMVDYAEIG